LSMSISQTLGGLTHCKKRRAHIEFQFIESRGRADRSSYRQCAGIRQLLGGSKVPYRGRTGNELRIGYQPEDR
jgi:hypothetical protein